MNNTPLYRYSYSDACRVGEQDQWTKSHKANKECANAIKEAISNGFEDNHLNGESAKSVIDKYGFDRVNYVLRINVKLISKDDPRISPENRAWANQNYISGENIKPSLLINCHPLLVNGFIDQAKREWDKLGLFDAKSCIDTEEPQNYQGKLLVINPNVLKDRYKTPDDQLFYATGGFGCHPQKLGRKVFGFFLKDGEETHFARGDFIGIIRDDCIPDWAYEKLYEMEEYDESESEGIGQST